MVQKFGKLVDIFFTAYSETLDVFCTNREKNILSWRDGNLTGEATGADVEKFQKVETRAKLMISQKLSTENNLER